MIVVLTKQNDPGTQLIQLLYKRRTYLEPRTTHPGADDYAQVMPSGDQLRQNWQDKRDISTTLEDTGEQFQGARHRSLSPASCPRVRLPLHIPCSRKQRQGCAQLRSMPVRNRYARTSFGKYPFAVRLWKRRIKSAANTTTPHDRPIQTPTAPNRSGKPNT